MSNRELKRDTQDMLTQQNDQMWEDLLMKATVEVHCYRYSSEVSEHNKILGDMQNNMGKTDTLLGRTLGKIQDMGKVGEASICATWFCLYLYGVLVVLYCFSKTC